MRRIVPGIVLASLFLAALPLPSVPVAAAAPMEATRAPSEYKDAWLACRSLNDQTPEVDPITLP